jgi:hypothetical protein
LLYFSDIIELGSRPSQEFPYIGARAKYPKRPAFRLDFTENPGRKSAWPGVEPKILAKNT